KSRHDVIAFLTTLEEELGEDARFIHRGLTSSDVVDTAFALSLKKASEKIEEELRALILALWQQAKNMQDVLILGRTHGQAAEPMTFGIKLLSHVAELVRGLRRLKKVQVEISVGKFSGAVGTYAYVHPRVEEEALNALGLKAETIATQVVARDRHASFFTSLAVIAGSIERLATELRLLAQSKLQEVNEPFLSEQKGSSAMPHKKNPILSENVCGLMRLVRSYALASMENQALWHERDISHSSVERVIAPDATSIMDFALSRLRSVIEDLVVNKERMAIHVKEVGDIVHSQGIMLALIDKGMGRKEAYELVQKAALGGHSFRDNLKKLGVFEKLSEEELKEICSSAAYKAHEQLLFERVRTYAQPDLRLI
ncbi:MAG TPA: adenylosuccinate lyase, partial [Myxococcota bacterium]|nr:adenylosuccinate lyase [Myxococcota bacterium]